MKRLKRDKNSVRMEGNILLTRNLIGAGRQIFRISGQLSVLPYEWQSGDKYPKLVERNYYTNAVLLANMVFATACTFTWWAVAIEMIFGSNSWLETSIAIFVTGFCSACLVLHISFCILRKECIELMRHCVQFTMEFQEKFVADGSISPKLVKIAGFYLRSVVYSLALAGAPVGLIPLFFDTSLTKRICSVFFTLEEDIWVYSALDMISMMYFVYFGRCVALITITVVLFPVVPCIAILGDYKLFEFTKRENMGSTSIAKLVPQMRLLMSELNVLLGIPFTAVQFIVAIIAVTGFSCGINLGGVIGGGMVLSSALTLIGLSVLLVILGTPGVASAAMLQSLGAELHRSQFVKKQLVAQQPMWVRTPFYYIDKALVVTMVQIVLDQTLNALILGSTDE